MLSLTCNCPDFQAAIAPDPSAKFFSEQLGSDWSASGAGMQNNQRYCKHIIRAMVLHGLIKDWDELSAILGYNSADFPSSPLEKFKGRDTRSRLQRNPRRGDDFS